MVHKQSYQAQQQRYIKRLVVQNSFQDHEASETINVLSSEAIITAVSSAFECVLLGLTDYECGEVLTDSRGRGTLQ